MAQVEALFIPSVQVFFGFAFVIALMGGAWFIENGVMTIGMLTTFTLYLGQLLSPMMQFGWQFSVFQRGSASWNRLEKLFNQEPSVKDAPDAVPAPRSKDLCVHIESFTYPDSQTQVLKDIYMKVLQGSFVGITGRTGSGKSSVFRLILREFNLEGGSTLTMGGTPLNQIQLKSLRQQLAWVPQEPMLFSGTIASNIAMSKMSATREEIEQAAKLAAIHDEIMAFKDGYETELGEQGINLSGGQKQRVAFARALLSDASILLLDDAFSALDMKTEATILKNLAAYHNQKTVLLITQRLPELIHADHIVVIDGGRITEQGSHRDLNENEGWYAKIFQQQARTLQIENLEQQRNGIK